MSRAFCGKLKVIRFLTHAAREQMGAVGWGTGWLSAASHEAEDQPGAYTELFYLQCTSVFALMCVFIQIALGRLQTET